MHGSPPRSARLDKVCPADVAVTSIPVVHISPCCNRSSSCQAVLLLASPRRSGQDVVEVMGISRPWRYGTSNTEPRPLITTSDTSNAEAVAFSYRSGHSLSTIQRSQTSHLGLSWSHLYGQRWKTSSIEIIIIDMNSCRTTFRKLLPQHCKPSG